MDLADWVLAKMKLLADQGQGCEKKSGFKYQSFTTIFLPNAVWKE
jgi:hypothetical protein